jgi:hypothetical protein
MSAAATSFTRSTAKANSMRCSQAKRPIHER